MQRVCRMIAFVQAEYLQPGYQYFKEQLSLIPRLLRLFQQAVFSPASTGRLSSYSVQVGGIENLGNSCILSVVLQELAALPAIYDPLLFSPFASRIPSYKKWEALRETLARCVTDIRQGKKVTRAAVGVLGGLLRHLGWQGSLSSPWRDCLSRLAPAFFALPQFNVYELYEKILECLLQLIEAPRETLIVLTRKRGEDNRSLAQFLNDQIKDRLNSPPSSSILWRISLDHPPSSLEEQVQIGSSHFSLQLIHAYRKTAYGKHVIVYRRMENEWISCDDTEIRTAKFPLNDTIYALVYTESTAEQQK